MDLVLFIIAICFRKSSEDHNYMALEILSVIGAMLCLLFTIFQSWIFWIDVAWFIVDWIICITADNKVEP